MNLGKRIKVRNEKKNLTTVMVKSLILMYVISGFLLFLLALLLYNLELSEATVKIGIIVIYILSGFIGGIWSGKQMQDRKYLWGLINGGIYFVMLFLVAMIVRWGTGEVTEMEPVRVLATLVLCAVSGMAGGMLS
ncbi:MAG: TIGR04086 family membrane protein [Roseburia sp.]|nr:TIGR04086 family membrane protein [Roseburia sp.]